ncbi:PREDICTED: zinc finger BED domain-containing protein RICESLEEPER 2-like [Lupinus angustifolius]|uniref:zinc finger BED domain-containing protein RICESLEEPER 2-like n=1 Tax=Lupinus angustifolius TaxID=3871 RepID=UPI00092F1B0E|nr:PREDICTED: zinc finger BED domain-containing protein RICESLEEPER 2-like [Lupinus angustifolius]
MDVVGTQHASQGSSQQVNVEDTSNTTPEQSHIGQDDNIESTTQPTSKRHRSVVWEHYEKIKVDGVDKAECKYCKKKIGGGSKNGTKHLHNHMELFIYVLAPHTSDILCHELVECFMDWNIDTKISTITLDNCSTNNAIIPKIKDKLWLENLLRDGSLLHMRCCAYILNLIVEDGLEVVKDGIEKIRDSVAYWNATPKRSEKFEETAKQLRVPYTKKLILDCPTRWKSTSQMLEVAISYKDVFNRLNQRDTQYTCLSSSSQWQFAEDVCERLKLFSSITEKIYGTKYPTANIYFPKICHIKLAITRWINSSNELIKMMAEKMMAKFESGSSPLLNRTVTNDEPLEEYDMFIDMRGETRSSSVKTELDHYLEEDVIKRTLDFDILNCTSVQILSPHRSRLNWTTLEALMCARSWLWSAEKAGNLNSSFAQEYATVLNEMESDDEGSGFTFRVRGWVRVNPTPIRPVVIPTW